MDQLQAEQELEFIRKVIAENRPINMEDGIPFIFWGIVVALGMLFTYIAALSLSQPLLQAIPWMWIALTVMGWIYTWWYGRSRAKKARSRTILEKIDGAVWGALGSTIALLIFIIMIGDVINESENLPPFYISSLVSMLLAIGYFFSGTIHQVPLLKRIAFGWWSGAIVLYFWHSVHTLALYAVMIIAFQIVPGILLYKNWKAATAQRESTPQPV